MAVVAQTSTATRIRPRLVLTALVLSVSVVLLGTTILNVALPRMTASLSLSNTAQQWVLNSYTLTFAGFLLISGSIGDRLGLRRTLLIGLTGFTVASALASLPIAVWFVIAMRASMGVFAATIMPTTLAIILRTFPLEKRGYAISVWAAASGLAISAGPLLGGALLSAGLWWGSVLALVAVLSAIAFLASWVGIHHLPAQHSGVPLHITPVLASAAGITLLVWGVLDGGQSGKWTAPGTLVPLIAGVVVLAGLVAIELRAEHPVADVRLFRRAEFTASVIALSISSFALFGYLYIATFYVQVELGYTPFETGLVFTPLSAGLIIGAPLSHRLSSSIGTRATVVVGLLLHGVGLGAIAFIDRHTALGWFLGDTFVIALGFALILTPATTFAMSAVPAHRTGGGSALLNTLRQLFSALGVAIIGSILWSSYRTEILPQLNALPPGSRSSAAQSLTATLQAAAGDSQVIPSADAAFVAAFHLTAIIAACMTLAAAIIVTLIRPSARSSALP